ncbi:MAG TPA: DUF3341 domain-containing protein [bacterium]|nr:DUF3341 domain-containing protein [bacterium]
MVKEYLFGIFTDETKLLRSVRRLRGEGLTVQDVLTPYAVHGLDDAMGLRRSRLALVTFFAGLFGLILAMGFQFWTSAFDWPLNVGGKPANSTLAFLPVTFEITVLIGGLSTVLAFFLRTRLRPGAKALLLEQGITNDRFVVVLEKGHPHFEEEKARRILMETGTDAITERSIVYE